MKKRIFPALLALFLAVQLAGCGGGGMDYGNGAAASSESGSSTQEYDTAPGAAPEEGYDMVLEDSGSRAAVLRRAIRFPTAAS